MQIKRGIDKGGHYYEEMKGWMQEGGIIRCKLNERMDKEGHNDVEIKGWMQKGAL